MQLVVLCVPKSISNFNFMIFVNKQPLEKRPRAILPEPREHAGELQLGPAPSARSPLAGWGGESLRYCPYGTVLVRLSPATLPCTYATLLCKFPTWHERSPRFHVKQNVFI